MYEERVEKLHQSMHARNLEGFLFNAGPTLTYLTGLHFSLMERPVLLVIFPGQRPVLILPELEMRKLDHAAIELDAYPYPEDPSRWAKTFQTGLAHFQFSGQSIGMEPGQFRLLEFQLVKAAVDTLELVDGTQAVGDVRALKDDNEIAAIQKAVSIAQKGLEQTLSHIKIGMSEFEVATELVFQLLKAGSEPQLPFSPLVSSGPNGANPHAKPSERVFEAGDLVVIDWGASCRGYVSDLTRTFGVGEIAADLEQKHHLVHMANRAGRRAGKPGVTCGSVDNAAREVIDKAQLGHLFTHRNGHGIGMECHEDPYIYSANDQLLQEGMTFTVEPGIYLAGHYGIRIEDDVVITKDGCRSLSDFPRSLSVIG